MPSDPDRGLPGTPEQLERLREAQERWMRVRSEAAINDHETLVELEKLLRDFENMQAEGFRVGDAIARTRAEIEERKRRLADEGR
jgi:hypothetical protein